MGGGAESAGVRRSYRFAQELKANAFDTGL